MQTEWGVGTKCWIVERGGKICRIWVEPLSSPRRKEESRNDARVGKWRVVLNVLILG